MEKQRTSTRGSTRGRTTSTGEVETGFDSSQTDPSTGATSSTSTPADIAGQGAQGYGAGSAETGRGANAADSGGSQRGGSAIVDKVKERATSQLSSQKGRATEGLDTIVQAVRQTTQQLRAEDHGTVAEYIDKAAEQIERFSTRLRDKDVNELMRDARQLARRQPAMFIGGSFALGLLAARFIKSSQRNGEEAYRNEGEAGFDRYNTGAY